MTAKDVLDSWVLKTVFGAVVSIASVVVAAGIISGLGTVQEIGNMIAAINIRLIAVERSVIETKSLNHEIDDAQRETTSQIQELRSDLSHATGDRWKKGDQKIWALQLDKDNNGIITVPPVD